MAMLSEGSEAAGLDLGLAFGFTNLGWGLGHALGAVIGPAIADSGGNDLAYMGLAVLSALALVAFLARRREVESALSLSATGATAEAA
jgi:predicted MFS family arabinose efflux permease